MPEDRHEYTVYYGFTPDRPLAFTVPPVQAQPDQPLPDAGPFLRICAGVEKPTTVMLRCAREIVGIWRDTFEHQSQAKANIDTLNEQLSVYTWLIDREAGGHTKNIAFQADAPVTPSSYGQWASWLVWKYLLYALRQHDPEHHERDAVELSWCIESFDALVDGVRCGRIRLHEHATDEFPPRTVTPQPGGTS
ncbi:hypothetical protein [Nocardia barduliensis]|uniref:hypothetical protein n=1 Tax=Nocardia barduliensis TaxID=2736643 RepID=UPI001573AD63|nr:hypothetical protein [Nocardia barduliensis]